MNIFILDYDPKIAATMLCDKHAAGKMAVESAQMLCTAHRILDGVPVHSFTKTGKPRISEYAHLELDDILYKSVHHSHPCTLWTMKSNNNYTWHYCYFIAMCDEYTYRYGKIHACDIKFRELLKTPPKNIPIGYKTQFPLAMNSNPECMFPNDPVKSYRLYYQTKQKRFKMVWTKREIPEWFVVDNECEAI